MIEAAAELPLRRRFNRIRKPVEETALLGRNVNTVCVCVSLPLFVIVVRTRDSSFLPLPVHSRRTRDYIVIARVRS